MLQPSRLAAQKLLIEQTWRSMEAEPFVHLAAALYAPQHPRPGDRGCDAMVGSMTNSFLSQTRQPAMMAIFHRRR